MKKGIFIFLGLAAVGGIGYYLYNKSKAIALPPGTTTATSTASSNITTSAALQAKLQASNFMVTGWAAPMPGSALNISVAPDGTVSIGSGYMGKFNGSAVVSSTRYGQPNSTVWQIV